MKYFYKVLLSMMGKFPPIKGLAEKEINVLAEILLQNYKYRDLEFNKRQLLIFSTEIRKEMWTNLGMNRGTLYNYLCKLRKKGVLTEYNQILPFLNIIPEDKYEFTILFELDNNE